MDTTALADANATYAQTRPSLPIRAPISCREWSRPRTSTLGGEGVAYHDTEPANLGGAYRPAEGVDIETSASITDVGWIRSGEWLDYTVNATEPQDFVVWLRPRTRTRPPSGSPSPSTAFPPGRSISGRPGRSTITTATFDTLLTPRRGDHGPALVRRGPAGQPVDLLSFESAGADARPDAGAELLVSTPGRYTLDHDLSSDAIGVLITSSDVVLDGMGHSITGTGANGSIGVFASGIGHQDVDDVITNVTVRNLTVRHWDDRDLRRAAAGSVVEDVVAEQNGVGLSITGGRHHRRPRRPRLRLPGEHRQPGSTSTTRPTGSRSSGARSPGTAWDHHLRSVSGARTASTATSRGTRATASRSARPALGRPELHHPRERRRRPRRRARRRRDRRQPDRGERRHRRGRVRSRRVRHPRQLDHRQRHRGRRRRRLADPRPEQRPEQHRQRVLRGGEAGMPELREDGRREHRRRPVPRRQLLGLPERHGLLPDPPGRRPRRHLRRALRRRTRRTASPTTCRSRRRPARP